MGQHRDRTPVPFRSSDMFDLVADVAAYPDFIPWVEALRVREGSRADGALVADMVIRYSVFRESFRSRVLFDEARQAISVAYIKGPLKTLTNDWVFEPSSPGSIIDFSISFEFRNPLLQTVANQLIEKVFLKLSGAFIDEAHRRFTPEIIEKQQ